ncbi:MAG: hypothetical protein ACLQAT_17885 [Candidatus Binataceae bacterium]
MRTIRLRILILCAVSLAIGYASVTVCSAASASDPGVPDYMNVIVGNETPSSQTQVADQNVLALDLAMFGIYDDSLQRSQANFMAQHPIIMALFSNQGGRLILYRPGQPPLEAPQVPIRYQMLKSVGHSALAILELAGSHLGTVADHSWVAPMQAFRAANQSALDSLDATDLSAETRANQADIIKSNIKFMDACLSKGTYTFADIQAYAQEVKPWLATNVHWAAATQVEHWMKVVKDWKEMLGSDWDRTYGVSNTLYVARQNNVLFSVLAQFFGKDAMNTRLFLFETSAFVTTPDQMLNVLIRTVSDRSVGMLAFGNYYLMDYELIGGDGREAIEAQDQKYGVPVYLPPLMPFHSWEWPFRIDPNQGEGPRTIQEIK